MHIKQGMKLAMVKVFCPYLFPSTKSYPSVGLDCRYDKANKKGVLNGYFLWLSIGYGVGEYTCNMVILASMNGYFLQRYFNCPPIRNALIILLHTWEFLNYIYTCIICTNTHTYTCILYSHCLEKIASFSLLVSVSLFGPPKNIISSPK